MPWSQKQQLLKKNSRLTDKIVLLDKEILSIPDPIKPTNHPYVQYAKIKLWWELDDAIVIHMQLFELTKLFLS